MKIGDGYQKAYAASFTYPMAERLKTLKAPCLLADFAGAASEARIARGKAAAPQVHGAVLPDDPARWREIMDPFFAS